MPMNTKLSTILLGGAAFAVIGAGFALSQAVDPRIAAVRQRPGDDQRLRLPGGYPARLRSVYPEMLTVPQAEPSD